MANVFDQFDKPGTTAGGNVFDQFDPPKKKAADSTGDRSRSAGEIIRDLGAAGLSGLVNVAKLPAMAIDRAVAGEWVGPGVSALNEFEDSVNNQKTDVLRAKEAASQAAVADAEKATRDVVGDTGVVPSAARLLTGFTVGAYEALKDPTLLSATVAQQLPMLGASKIAGAGAEALAKGAATAMPAAAATKIGSAVVGNAGTAGAVAGGAALQSADIGADTHRRLMQVPDAEWAQNPEYRALAAKFGPDAAKRQMANDMAFEAAMAAGTASVLSSMLPGGASLERALMGKAAGGVSPIKAVGSAVAGEARQEGIEEGFGALAANDALRKIRPGQDMLEGVGGAAGQGAALGGLMGGGTTAMALGGKAAQDFRQAPANAAAGQDAAPVAAEEVLGVEPAPAAAPVVSDAEKDLLQPRMLTTLDRVNEIDAALPTAPEADREALQVERANLTKDWPAAVPGASTTFSTEAGARLGAQYALMEVTGLQTSHDEDLRRNPVYPQELQPRERDRAASEMQVQQITQKLDPARLGLSADSANGAPIVGADGLVESGNARTIALKRIYKVPGQKASEYRGWLRENAAQFGLQPEQVDGMTAPVLVRVRTTPVNRAEFARQANASTVAAMSPVEQARADAKRIDDMGDLTPDDNGDFATSRDFIRRFMARMPITEQGGMVDADGRLSSTGYARVRNAVLAKAYGDSPILTRMVESMDDSMRNLSKALMIAAPRVARAREAIGAGALFDADITPHLVEAAQELGRLKDAGTSVQDALAQVGLMGDTYSPETREMLQFLSDNARRPRRMAEFVGAYFDALEAAGDPRQGGMFGEPEAPAKTDLMTAARRETEGAQDAAIPAQDTQRGVNREAAPAGEGPGQQSAPAQGDQVGARGDGAAGAAAEGWEFFGPETGTLGIPRAEMPQVKGEHRGALINFLEARGIGHENDVVPASSLKPTQAEYSRGKVDKFVESGAIGARSVMVSSDGHVLDGHHQWLGHAERGEDIPVIRLDAPIRELLDAVNAFPSVRRSNGSSAARDQVRADFKNALADLAQIASRHTRAAMVKESTPDLMPTLIRLFEAGVKEVGYSMKDLLAYVKTSIKNDPALKTFWNKISGEMYRKAARQAIDNLPPMAMIDGRPYNPKRDNFQAPSVADFMDAEILKRADGYVERYYKDRPPVPLSAEDRAKAEQLLAPLLEKAAADKVEYDQKIIDIALRTKAIGQMIAPIKGMKRAAEKLALEEGFNLSGMKDLLRSTIVVSSYADAQQVLSEIEKEFQLLRKPKNRTNDFPMISRGEPLPADDMRAKDGYTDVLVNVVMPSGVIAEIQINVPEMLAAKEGQGHKLYEAYREAPKESPLGQEIMRSMRGFYVAAFDAAAARHAATELKNAASSELNRDDARGNPLGTNDAPSSEIPNTLPSGNFTRSSPPNESKNSQPGGNLSGTFIASSSNTTVSQNQESVHNTGTGGDPNATSNGRKGPAGPKDEDPAADTKLSRGAGGGIDLPSLKAVADRISKAMPGMPRVHSLASPTVAAVPKALRKFIEARGAMGDVEGAFHAGEIYLFASGIVDEARAEHVLAEHEAAHAGLAGLLGAGKARAMQAIANQNPAVRKAATARVAQGVSLAEAVEEVLVDIPSRDLARLKGWRALVGKVRDAFKAGGFDRLAAQIDRWLAGHLTEQQKADLFVADLVREARGLMRRPPAPASARERPLTPALSDGKLSDDLAAQEAWLTREAKGRGYKDIEDLLERNYPLFEKLAALWREKHPASALLSRAAQSFKPVDVTSESFKRWFGASTIKTSPKMSANARPAVERRLHEAERFIASYSSDIKARQDALRDADPATAGWLSQDIARLEKTRAHYFDVATRERAALATAPEYDGTPVPRAMYHATVSDFSTFKVGKEGAIYLASSPADARKVAEFKFHEGGYLKDEFGIRVPLVESLQILPLYVRAENPWDPSNEAHVAGMVAALEASGERLPKRSFSLEETGMTFTLRDRVADGEWEIIESAPAQAYIRSQGHDGFWAKEKDEDGGMNLAVYSANQVKSAISNTGDFSTANDDIRMSRAAVAGSAPAKTATERADEIIQTAAGTPKPLDAAAKLLTRVTGIEKVARVFYGLGGRLIDRLTPETVKAGIVSDYGVPEAVIDQRAMMQGRQREQLRQAGVLLSNLSTMTRAESRVAYEWMNMDGTEDPRAYVSMMQGLPEESVKVLQEVQGLIDSLSKEAVRLGQLDPEAFKRHRFAYLRRSYYKHAAEMKVGDVAKPQRVISILGEQYKGRGMVAKAAMRQIQNIAPEWWQRKMVAGKADTALKGEKFIRFEKRAPAGEKTMPLDGMEGKARGPILELAYWPAGEKAPARFADWDNAGTWEVRDVKGADAVMWRDFTKEEREKMGEIDEARYAIAKTLHGMIHDVEVGRYLEWLAKEHALKEGQEIPGVVVEASERYKDTFKPGEWVQVPESQIKGTSVQKYGLLAGRYVPGPIWNDLRQVVGGRFQPLGETYDKILKMWKVSKALALDTPIPTPTGWTTMGEIEVGDEVFDEQGQPCRVLGATPVQMNRRCYRVEFSDGTSIVADAEHLWFTVRRGQPGVRTTEDVRRTLRERTRGDANHMIPVAGALQIADVELPIAPYVLGAWLGDGDTNRARITQGAADAPEIIANLEAAGVRCAPPNRDKRSSAMTFWVRRGENSCIRGHGLARMTPKGCAECMNLSKRLRTRGELLPPGQYPSIQERLRASGLLGNKHIPAAYLRASEAQRRELLMGLMDTDGNITERGLCSFTTTLPALRDGALELLRSLGYKPMCNSLQPMCGGRPGKPAWRIDFKAYADSPVFKLSRKRGRLAAAPKTRQRSQTRAVVAITPIESVPVRCIAVSSKSRLYLAGEGMVPTHNTSLSPAVHMNNVMSNFVMADWHDVSAGHVQKALRILLGALERDGTGAIGRAGNLAARLGIGDREAAQAILTRYQDSGGSIGGWLTQEIANDQLEPIVEALKAEIELKAADAGGGEVGVYSALQHLLHARFGAAWEAAKGSKPGQAIGTEGKNLLALYSSEDDVFRLAAWLKAKEEGKTDLEAGKVSRRSFLDYSINAPWVQAARQTALPFISFTYRALPMLLHTAGTKPHKLMKLMALAGALNWLGVMLGGGGDDRERKMLPEEKAGRVWGLVPKLIRMPWNDKHGSPVYLDIRRWIPVGDVADLGQGHSALPIPPSLMPGGPLAVALEVVFNRSMFTGKAIALDTDTATEHAKKLADHLWKAAMPNVAFIPGTYAWSGISDSLSGRTDTFGRDLSPGMAVANTVGVKLGAYPADVLRRNLMGKANAEIMEIEKNVADLKRQRRTNRITAEELSERIREQVAKEVKVRRELAEKMR